MLSFYWNPKTGIERKDLYGLTYKVPTVNNEKERIQLGMRKEWDSTCLCYIAKTPEYVYVHIIILVLFRILSTQYFKSIAP